MLLITANSLTNYAAVCSLISSSVYANLDFSTLLQETSVWNFLVCVIFTSLLGLWGFSAYLEFDSQWSGFVLRLLAFLLAVWLVLNSSGTFLLLVSWEIVGLVSFMLISTWYSRTLTISSAFSAIGFNRIGDVFFVADNSNFIPYNG